MSSKIAESMKKQMQSMPDEEFQNMTGVDKSTFYAHLQHKSEREQRCIAELNRPAPDFTARKLDKEGDLTNESIQLSALLGRPVAIILGSYTCPMFRKQMSMMQKIVKKHRNNIQFLYVYVSEAHPADGWVTPSNEREKILYNQPQNLEERAAVAKDWMYAHHIQATILIDDIDNKIDDDYSGKPERLYAIDAKGIICFKSDQGPFDEAVINEWEGIIQNQIGA